MYSVILKNIDVGSFFSDSKKKKAQEKINAYIAENELDVVSVSLFKENEDNYLFTITVRKP